MRYRLETKCYTGEWVPRLWSSDRKSLRRQGAEWMRLKMCIGFRTSED